MSKSLTKRLTLFAPAKINLYLHVTGRLDNGYHTLDSLVGFADIGDKITIEPANNFTLEINGAYANDFGAKEHDASSHSSNLVVQAVWALSHLVQKIPDIRITLTKNLPLASGLGGGSSDAAAVIRGLLQWWGISPETHNLLPLMSALGADVPACLHCKAVRMRGIGEILDPAPSMCKVAILLVNPGKNCPTADIFTHYDAPFKEPISLPETLDNFEDLIEFLKAQSNDLEEIALQKIPDIEHVIKTLTTQEGCALSRMSGSGASVFGLFENEEQAKKAAATLSNQNSDWWVKSGYLGRPECYSPLN